MTFPPRKPLPKGYSAAVASAVLLSTTAIFIRYLTQTYQLPALVLAFWRDVFVVLTLLLVLGMFAPRLLKIQRQDLRYLIVYGFVLAAFNSLWTLSVALNGAAVATVLVYSSSGFTALLGWLLLQERMGWDKLLAVAVTLAGCVLVSGAVDPAVWQVHMLGILIGVVSGISYAAYSLMGRSAAQRGLNPWTTLIWTFGFAAVFLLAVNLLPGGVLPGAAVQARELFWLGNAWAGWGVLFLLAALPTVAGFGLYNVSLSHLPSSVANLIVSLEPAFTLLTAYFLLGETFNRMQAGGALMILGSVVFLRLMESRLAHRAGPMNQPQDVADSV